MTTSLPRRAGHSLTGRVLVGLLLTLALLAGCSSEGADTDCGLDRCTVTFDRGVDASVNILGVEAKLIGADGDRVTMEVAGERLSLTVGQAATEVGGLAVSVTSATDQQVVVDIARAG
ncbi:MAG TPA: hypothetical protein VES42_28535 [Pilimelia sp.]|nr:hypothetical protein [Pilimelia sp.]